MFSTTQKVQLGSKQKKKVNYDSPFKTQDVSAWNLRASTPDPLPNKNTNTNVTPSKGVLKTSKQQAAFLTAQKEMKQFNKTQQLN